MELIIYWVIGIVSGSLLAIVIATRLFKPTSTVDTEELIKQSEERLEKLKEYGKELDRMLEESKK
jgi:hypothetical protein